ncbi:MAG TPA: helix-turn-helix domain-containing protein [Streptosporangiaceae bacterium]|nr:helix-turn-helix domain-containing protein [Streptosporangiaceae bacterium]
MSSQSRPLRRDAQRNRALLVAAAREVFGVKGLDAPLEEIARKAGVAIGTLYNRFPTRAALIEAAFLGILEQAVEICEGALKLDDPWDGFVYYLEQTCEMQAMDRGLTELCAGNITGAPGLDAAKARGVEALHRIIERAQKAGQLRADFQVADLTTLVSATARAAEYGPDPDSWRRHLGFLLDGLRANG